MQQCKSPSNFLGIFPSPNSLYTFELPHGTNQFTSWAEPKNPRIFLHNIGSNEISLPHTKGLQPYFSFLYESILFFLRKFQPLASTPDDRQISQLVFSVDEIEYQISYSIIKYFTSLAN